MYGCIYIKCQEVHSIKFQEVPLDGHEFEQAPEVNDGQGGLACCSLWGGKESDMTEQLN